MIYYLSSAAHDYTMRRFLESWGRPLGRLIRPLSYERVLSGHRAPRGAYVFSDVERLSPQQAELAARLHAALTAAGLPVLNHPTRAWRRYELLRRLHDAGENPFDVWRLNDGRLSSHYPVFLRTENEHRGAASELLHTPDELATALARWDAEGRSREHALIVEFCDTADADGLYRKYSVLRMGGQYLPRHLFFGPKWMLKVGAKVVPEHLDIERAFLRDNPHIEQVRAVFERARIEYGRIDYSMHHGRMVVWEINTNPHLATYRDFGGAARHGVHQDFTAAYTRAIQPLDVPASGTLTWRAAPPGRLRRWRKALRKHRRAWQDRRRVRA